MIRILLAFAAMFGVLFSPVSHAGGDRIAVLELRGAFDADVLSLMTDEVRGGVLDTVRGENFIVMTRENMAIIAKDMGKDLSCLEGECEVETGRNLNAAYVVAGEIVKLGSHFVCTLKVLSTDAGALLGSDNVKHSDPVVLMGLIRALSRDLMAQALGRRPSADPVAVTSKPRAGLGQAEAQTGRTSDYAALAAQAARAKTERERFERRERQAQDALEAERRRRIERVREDILAKASADFNKIRPLLRMEVTAETRPILQAYINEYETVVITIDRKRYKVTVPEVAHVLKALRMPSKEQRNLIKRKRQLRRRESQRQALLYTNAATCWVGMFSFSFDALMSLDPMFEPGEMFDEFGENGKFWAGYLPISACITGIALYKSPYFSAAGSSVGFSAVGPSVGLKYTRSW